MTTAAVDKGMLRGPIKDLIVLRGHGAFQLAPSKACPSVSSRLIKLTWRAGFAGSAIAALHWTMLFLTPTADAVFWFLLRAAPAYTRRVIDTDEKLSACLAQLRAASWLAVDTEADSLHAYPEKVCLIQISTAAGDELVDPLSGIDLVRLLEALSGHELIMHGADYDLRLLRKHHQFVPGAVFDTMLAARLLGHRQFGLGNLVAHYLGLTLEKGSQKANWARRPLTERMEHYARNDTHHLKPLTDKLKLELQHKGRLAWHQESCAQLVADCARPPSPDSDSAWRIKGSSRLNRKGLAILRELWQWRESEAIAADRPPYFILSHESLVEVAAHAATASHFDRFVPQRFSYRRRGELLKAVECGMALPAEAQPEILRPVSRQPSEQEKRRFRELERRRDSRAAKLGIDPTVIASRGTLGCLAHDWDAHAHELMNWQRELLEM